MCSIPDASAALAEMAPRVEDDRNCRGRGFSPRALSARRPVPKLPIPDQRFRERRFSKVVGFLG
jgi:hypothetical protein